MSTGWVSDDVLKVRSNVDGFSVNRLQRATAEFRPPARPGPCTPATPTPGRRIPAGNPYISAKTSVTLTDPRNGQPADSPLSTQNLDQYGNVLQSVIYPYNNNTTTPLRTYNNTYLGQTRTTRRIMS